MKVAIAANEVGARLKDVVKEFLAGKGYEMVDLSDPDIFTATMNVVEKIQSGEITHGIVVDDYGIAPFNIAVKNHGIVCASVYEDYSSSMTRHHNGTQIIAMAANITADVLSCELAYNFVTTEYDGGRHQIRLDMMNAEL